MFKALREKLAFWKSKAGTDEKAADPQRSPDSSAANAKAGPQSIYSDDFFARKIKEDAFNDLLWDLEIGLMESDVAVPVIEEIKENLKKSLVGKKVRRDLGVEDAIEQALREAIAGALTLGAKTFDEYIKDAPKPVILLFVGINGTGKTTTIAKIAHRLQKMGYSCILAAGDTFRAGAIEQLERHSEKLQVRLVKHKAGADPAAVAYDAIEHAKARHRDVVLIDSAGRMQTNANLMDEMKKIRKVASPHMVIFVGDALAGNDAIEQARTFDDGIGIDGVILNKIDADAKGGAALSIAHTIKKPILFVGTGQEYGDLIEFSPDWMVQRLFSDR